jgi:hypothetical protein
MPRIVVSTDEGEVIEIFEMDEVDLSKFLASSHFLMEIQEALNRARFVEDKET